MSNRSIGVGVAVVALVFAGVGSAQAADGEGDKTSKQIKKLKRQVKALKERVDDLADRPGPRGPQGPAGPAGETGAQGPQGAAGSNASINGVAAGGELAGTYPNPTIGTVAGLDLAASTSPSGGINFGTDASLFRLGPDTLQTNDSLFIDPPVGSSGLAVNGAGVFTEGLGPPSADTVLAPGVVELDAADPSGEAYIQFDEAVGVINTYENTVKLAARDVGDTTQLVAVFHSSTPPDDVVVIAEDPDPTG